MNHASFSWLTYLVQLENCKLIVSHSSTHSHVLSLCISSQIVAFGVSKILHGKTIISHYFLGYYLISSFILFYYLYASTYQCHTLKMLIFQFTNCPWRLLHPILECHLAREVERKGGNWSERVVHRLPQFFFGMIYEKKKGHQRKIFPPN